MRRSNGIPTRSIPSSTSTPRTIWRGRVPCSEVDDVHFLARFRRGRAGGAADQEIGGGERRLRAGILIGEQADRLAIRGGTVEGLPAAGRGERRGKPGPPPAQHGPAAGAPVE